MLRLAFRFGVATRRATGSRLFRASAVRICKIAVGCAVGRSPPSATPARRETTTSMHSRAGRKRYSMFDAYLRELSSASCHILRPT